VRHSLVLDYALRPLVSYLGGVTVPTGVYAATADLGGPGAPKLADRIERWWRSRPGSVPRDGWVDAGRGWE